MPDFLSDFRHSVRRLAKTPGFTIVAILTLALGIGGNTAIFSVIDAVLLNPLPAAEPGRVMALMKTFPKTNAAQSTSYPDYLEWKKALSFETVAASYDGSFSLTGQGEPEQLNGSLISHDFFKLLGVSPILGRTFLAEEEPPDQARSVILSEGLWKRRFGRRADIIGQQVTLNGNSFAIVGVMPGWFRFPPNSSDLWAPLAVDSKRAPHGYHFLWALGRLKPGATVNSAQAEMNTIAVSLGEAYPETNRGWGILVRPMTGFLGERARPALTILMCAVGLVLLIACANVASLMLVRASARSKEIAIRTALGAGRGRLIWLVMSESLLLSVAGGALGLVIAYWSIDGLTAVLPALNASPESIRMNGSVLLFTLGVSLLTGLLFGLMPSLKRPRADLHDELKEAGRAGQGGTERSRMRSVLVVAEVAMALMLLVGAGLLLKSFYALSNVAPGFQPEYSIALNLAPPTVKYRQNEDVMRFYGSLLDRLRTLPGVTEVGAVDYLPLSGSNSNRAIAIEGHAPRAHGDFITSNRRVATPGYLRSMGIQLAKGRHFEDSDRLDSPPVVIVNETMAKTYWPNQDAIGKRFALYYSPKELGPWLEVVGVYRDVRHFGLNQDARPEMIQPHAQMPGRRMTVVVRSAADPASLAGAIRAEVRGLDPDLPIARMQTMNTYVAQSVRGQKSSAVVFAAFAGFALLLAAVGLYGVISYSVQQRTHELGIRIALGAARSDLLKMVVGQALRLAAIGAVIGIGGALAASRLLTNMLFGVEPRDASVFSAVPAVLLAVTCLAGYLPARKAAQVDPMVALRQE